MNVFSKLMELRRSVDVDGMLDRIISFPAQMEDAWARGGDFAAGIDTADVDKVVVFGMGGSAIGGDMVRSCLGDALRVPLHVNRSYDVPVALRDRALFVFSSYSGNTGETLSAYDSVRDSLGHAVAITSGGELAKRCAADGVPTCIIPGGKPPRSAIAYSFLPLLRALEASGLANLDGLSFERALDRAKATIEKNSSESDENLAASLADRIHGKWPLVYSGTGLFEAVARRWSCQFNENGKMIAHFATFPELNHNEIVGWTPLQSLPPNLIVLSLEDSDDHAMTKKQISVALDIIEPMASEVVRLNQFGGDRMERILSAMLLGDLVSVYLAYLNGQDPTPVSNIDLLKGQLN